MTKKLISIPPRCGKTISQYICPECKTPLKQINETLFYCSICEKKVKAGILPIKETPIKINIPVTTGQLQLSTEKPNFREQQLEKWFKTVVNERVRRRKFK